MNKLDFFSHNWLAHRINNEALAAMLPLVQGRVVDLGCGTAPYKAPLLTRASEYVGVDWPNSLHDQSHVDVFADLGEPLPFPDGHADTVVSFQVMEHLAEPGRFLAECHRLLRPEGALCLTVPFMWHVHEAPHDYFRYTRHGLEYLLKRSGFVEVAVTENTGFWQMIALKLSYHTRRFAPGPVRWLWLPFWFTLQALAPLLDRLDPHPQETGSYRVTARKPPLGTT